MIGVAPSEILAEEVVRARILEQMNKMGMRDMLTIGEMVRDYYYTPEALLKKLGLGNLSPVIRM
jgi:hypothetical protein